MIFPKCFSIKTRGIILVDILVALSLGVLFIAIISESSRGAHDLFTEAQARNEFLDSYDSGNVDLHSQMYGNERMEQIFATGTLEYSAVTALPLTDIKDAAGTPLCSVDFQSAGSGVSTSTPIVAQVLLPIDPALPLTHLEVRDGFAYVSTDSASAADPDLLIFDIRDATHPMLMSSINTGPGITSFALAGRRIYAAADSTATQLHVIRMDSLSSLVLEKKFKLPLPFATATPPTASSIFYNKNHVYLGTTKWAGDEFSVINVSTPTTPVKTGGFEVNSIANDILIHDGMAYVASADANQLQVLDVHDAAHPFFVQGFSPSGWSRQEGKVVSFFEGALSMGRTSGGFNFTTDHEAFTWATTSSTTLASPISIDEPGGVYGLVADKSHIFMATRDANKEFRIFDRTLSASSSISVSLPIAPQSLTCDRDSLYVLAHSGPYIYEITFK